MRVALRIIVLLGICYIASPLLSTNYFLPALLLFLFGFAGLVIAVPVTLSMGIGKWRATSRLWVLPFLLAVALLVSPGVTTPLQAQAAEWRFKANVDVYTHFVESIQNGTIPTKSGWNNIDPQYLQQLPGGIMRVMALRNSKGLVAVEFYLVSSALAHTGYLYKAYGDSDSSVTQDVKPEDGLQLRHIVGKWYSFST